MHVSACCTPVDFVPAQAEPCRCAASPTINGCVSAFLHRATQMPLAVPMQAEQQLTNSDSARLRMEDLHEEALARIDLLADSLEAAESQASQAQVRGGHGGTAAAWCCGRAPPKPCMP